MIESTLERQLNTNTLERWSKYNPATISGNLEAALSRVSDQVVGREKLLNQTLFAFSST